MGYNNSHIFSTVNNSHNQLDAKHEIAVIIQHLFIYFKSVAPGSPIVNYSTKLLFVISG